MAAIRHMGFWCFPFLSKNQISAYFYVVMQNMGKSGASAAEFLRTFDFQYGGRPSSWIFVLSQYLSKIQTSAYFYVDMQNLVAAELLRICDFQHSGRPPSWIWYDVIADHLRLVFDGPDIVLKSEVDRVYLYFARYRDFLFGPFGLKLPIHAPFGKITPKWILILSQSPKGPSVGENTLFES